MARISSKASVYVFILIASTTLLLAKPCEAQEVSSSQAIQLDKTQMSTYRALAQFSYQAFQKGDYATANTLGRILERSWDRGEQCGLAEKNYELRQTIDHAMDGFIKSLAASTSQKPDPTAVKTAYEAYLKKLKLAD